MPSPGNSGRFRAKTSSCPRIAVSWRGTVRVTKLMEEFSTIAITQHDAETRFRALAARGSVKAGLGVLDKLNNVLGRVARRET